MKSLKTSRMTMERLFAELRRKGIRHLDEVKRFYFEANGDFTLIPAESPRPGLSILPDFDQEFINEQRQSDEVVCCVCGNNVIPEDLMSKQCANCNGHDFQAAIE
jgi:uncharacterized membrane protein YcaP (DUF421 family)